MKTAIIHARIEPRTKRKAESILAALGLTPTEAIRLFYHQIGIRKGIPFPVEMPNARTAATLQKSRSGKEIRKFKSPEEMFASWEE